MVIALYVVLTGVLIIAFSLWVKKKEKDLEDPFLKQSEDPRVSSHTRDPFFQAAVQDRMNGSGSF